MTVTTEPPVTSATCLGSTVLTRLNTGTLSDSDIVTWVSEHVAALEQALYPVARRHLPDQQLLRTQQVQTRAVEQAVRRLHQRINGDGAAMHLSLPRVRAEVHDRLRTHEQGERELEDQLRATVGAQAWDDVVLRYREALDSGPTRPHPNAPHDGWSGRVARSVLTRVDRLLDALDARSVQEPPACG
jgi:hypothetical protein